MPFASRPLLVRILGVAALALFGLNFATWAHGRYADRAESCRYPAAFTHSDAHGAEDYAIDVDLESADVQVYRWDAERAAREAERAARALEVRVVERALQAAGDHLDDERVAHLLERQTHLEARAEVERALRAASQAGVIAVR